MIRLSPKRSRREISRQFCLSIAYDHRSECTRHSLPMVVNAACVHKQPRKRTHYWGLTGLPHVGYHPPMKIVIQRVQRAKVTVDSEVVGEISAGLLLLVGFGKGDMSQGIAPVVDKILNMRIFSNEQGRFDRSLLDIQGEVLAVSQFTLYADTSKGRRPEFFGALDPASAEALFEEFLQTLRNAAPSKVAAGRFGAMMQVELVNDGPVTITLEQ